MRTLSLRARLRRLRLLTEMPSARVLVAAALLLVAATGSSSYVPPLPTIVPYGALYDAVADLVLVWADVLPKSAVSNTSFFCELRAPDAQQPVPAALFELANHKADAWAAVRLACSARGKAPAAVVIQPGLHSIAVRRMRTARAGRLAACVATLYSHTPSLPEWLAFNARAGVELVVAYHMAGGALEAARGGDIYQGSHRPVDSMLPFAPFAVDGVEWRAVKPGMGRWQLGQSTAHSLCMYELRYAFDYVMCVLAECCEAEWAHLTPPLDIAFVH